MFTELNFVKKEISTIAEIKNNKHRILGKDQVKDFIYRTRDAITLVLQEKEILLFVFLQFIVIALTYLLWIQMLAWIPTSVWSNDDKLSNTLLNIIFLAWSFLVVGIAAYPLGILSGCIGATHFLRKQGYPATIASCLKIVLPKASILWTFFWIDAWITVNQIFDRLPSKYKTDSALQELLYFSWKLGTIGMLPSILNGRHLITAGKESIDLVKKHPKETLLLRGGYSLFCWIIGIGSYIGAIVFFIYNTNLFGTKYEIYKFYFWMGVPILLAVSIVLFFLRPIYVIASCELYTDYVQEEKIDLSVPARTSKFMRGLIIFITLLIILGIIFIFREPLGIMHILRVQK